MPSTSKLSITQHSPQYWRVTFDNPPINLIDPEMIVALYELLTTIEQDNRVAVVVFDSADPEFFMAHYDLTSDPSPLDALPAAPTRSIPPSSSQSPGIQRSSMRTRSSLARSTLISLPFPPAMVLALAPMPAKASLVYRGLSFARGRITSSPRCGKSTTTPRLN